MHNSRNKVTLKMVTLLIGCLLRTVTARGGGGGDDSPDHYNGIPLTFLGQAYLPHLNADTAHGLRFTMSSWLKADITDTLPNYLSTDDNFFNDVKTIIMDQASCVYYTTFGTVYRDESTGYPARTCDIWPPQWSTELPSVTAKMDVYVSQESIGINRIDFRDNDLLAPTYAYQDTCVSHDPLDKMTLDVTSTDPIEFYWAFADDHETSVHQHSLMHWMLKLVRSGANYQFDGFAFGEHPYHNGALRLDLHLDTSQVVLVGFQAASDQIYPATGAAFMGLYYQVKDCASVPACSLTVAQLTASISVKQDELPYVGTSSYSHTFSLDSAATCIVFPPTTFSVTHDYADTSAITATLSQVTSGSYVDL